MARSEDVQRAKAIAREMRGFRAKRVRRLVSGRVRPDLKAGADSRTIATVASGCETGCWPEQGIRLCPR